MPSVSFAPYAVPQFLDNAGQPVSGGTLETYLAGTSTPAATYADSAGVTANPTTITLDTAGRPSNGGSLVDIRLDASKSYKFVLKNSSGVELRTVDNITAIGSATVGTAALTDDSVTTAKLVDGAVTAPKLPSDQSGLLAITDKLLVQQDGSGSYARPLDGKVLEARFSVLDFIDPSLHSDIRAGTYTGDLTAAFQAAARACVSQSFGTDGQIGRVFVPNGKYYVTKIGCRGTIFRGESREGTVIRAYSVGTSADFMFDAMLDRDGVTTNTIGNGWCENMNIDGRLESGVNSGRSGIRTYGGGVGAHQLYIRNCGTGLAIGLPIWGNIADVYAVQCNVGFYTFHEVAGDNGTSLTMLDCWADSCTTYGFHISQLYYSSFINCVAQDCGSINWYLEGDLNGNAACYSLQFIGCATEGTGVPFYFKKARELTVISPRIISPDAAVDFITLDDCTGSITDFSTPGAPGAGKYHLSVLNHNGGNGTIIIEGGDITYDPANEPFISFAAGRGNGVQRVQSQRHVYNDAVAAQRMYAQTADVDGTSGLVLHDNSGNPIMAVRRTGTPWWLTNGAIASPSTNLPIGAVAMYATNAAVTFQVRCPDGVVRSGTVALS